MLRSLPFAIALLGLCLTSTGAWAAVEISFYSRELGGSSFPHAFVTMKGTLDRDGTAVDEALGFTAKSVTPALLMGSVGGKVVEEKAGQISRSDRQFSLVLSDERYDAVMATVESWRTRRQPSYNLNRANCVHFAGELARAAGLDVEFPKELMKKPRSFLLAVKARNDRVLAADSGARAAADAATR